MNSVQKINNFEEQLKTVSLLEEYGALFKDYLHKKVEDDFLNKIKSKLKIVPNELIDLVEFFAHLDYEFELLVPEKVIVLDYMLLTGRIKSPWSRCNDTEWRGYWLYASGLDKDLFLNWIKSALKYPQYQEHDLEYWFKKAHPRSRHIPYSVKTANKMLKKYFIS